jgi:VWFA-related protein
MSSVILPLVALALVAMQVPAPEAQPAQSAPAQPTFRTGVDLIRLDVTVVGKDGTPVADLDPEDFEVRVEGKTRPVVTSRFLSLAAPRTGLEPVNTLATTRDFTRNDAGLSGRLFVYAVDQESLPTGAGRPLMESVSRLLDGLGPADRVALVTIPQPGQRLEFTRDVDEIKRGLQRVVGRRQSRVRTVRVDFREAQAFESRDQNTIAEVVDRECVNRIDASCPDTLRREAQEVLNEGRQHVLMSLTGLSGLADSLTSIDGPKTVIYFSGGLGFEERSLDRFKEVARKAAEARIMLYTIHVDSFSFDASERAASAAFMGDHDAGLEGLGTLSAITGGVIFRNVGKSPGVVSRIERESSGMYVLGVEPEPGTSATTPLDIKVRVKRGGLTVRTPQIVIASAPLATWSSPKRAVGYTLRQPRLATELPMRLTSYTFRGTDPRRLKTILAAELALPLSATVDLTWGFEVLDKGRVIADAFDYGLPLGSTATDDTVVLVTACALPPGRYSLKFAVMDKAGRRGSVEHPLEVGLRQADPVQFSDLLVGNDDGETFRPQLEFKPGTSELSALVEVYGNELVGSDQLTVEFDLRGLDGITRSTTRVRPSATEASQRLVATAQLPVGGLGTGSYNLHAKVLVAGRPIGMVRRQLTIGEGVARTPSD